MHRRALETLREILYGPASEEAWRRVVEAIDQMGDAGMQVIAIDYAEPALPRWPAELRIAPRPWWLSRLAEQPHPAWPLIGAVEFDLEDVRDVRAGRFLKSPGMLEVTALKVRRAKLDGKGLRSLLEGVEGDRIEVLDLSHNAVKDAADVHALDGLAGFSALKVLRLRRNGLTPRGIEALSRMHVVGALSGLDLSGNVLDLDTLSALWCSGGLVGLKELVIEEAGIDDRMAGAFSSGSGPVGLVALSLAGNALSGGGLWELAEVPMFSRLDRIDLSRNGLFWRDIRALTKATDGLRCGALTLDGNRLEDQGVARLASWAGLSHLRALSLVDNQITDEGAAALAGAAWIGALEHLNLSGNDIGARGVAALREAFGGRADKALVFNAAW